MVRIKLVTAIAAVGLLAFRAAAWDYEGHHAVNEMAWSSLPANFPAFVLTPEARARIAYLAGEPDRWRNEVNLRGGTGLALGHVNAPDHYLDLEDLALYDLTPGQLPPLRYDFVADIVKARAAHPERFAPADLGRDSDHTRELSGFLPWAITENYEKLQSGFSALAALRKYGGTPEEINNAQQNIVYVMGVMGHFVGDASQPLHTTKHFNGWVGDNPNGYTTDHRFHPWIDGGFFRNTGGLDEARLCARIHPARTIAAAADPNGIFRTVVEFIVANNRLVEPLYRLQKEGKLSDHGNAVADGRAWLEGQLVKSGQLLGDLWLTAWETAPADTFLERELQQRAGPPVPAPAPR
jgi:hypothetical protein